MLHIGPNKFSRQLVLKSCMSILILPIIDSLVLRYVSLNSQIKRMLLQCCAVHTFDRLRSTKKVRLDAKC